MVDFASVRNARLFQGVTDDGFKKLAPIAREVAVAAGECLFRIGEPADTIYIVETGVLDLIVPIKVLGVTKDVEVAKQTCGDTVAWSALVEPFRLMFTARAKSAVTLLAFTRSDLLELFAADAGLGLTIMGNLGGIIGKRLDWTMKMWFAEVERDVTKKYG